MHKESFVGGSFLLPGWFHLFNKATAPQALLAFRLVEEVGIAGPLAELFLLKH
jgi:hypothetical protein